MLCVLFFFAAAHSFPPLPSLASSLHSFLVFWLLQIVLLCNFFFFSGLRELLSVSVCLGRKEKKARNSRALEEKYNHALLGYKIMAQRKQRVWEREYFSVIRSRAFIYRTFTFLLCCLQYLKRVLCVCLFGCCHGVEIVGNFRMKLLPHFSCRWDDVKVLNIPRQLCSSIIKRAHSACIVNLIIISQPAQCS